MAKSKKKSKSTTKAKVLKRNRCKETEERVEALLQRQCNGKYNYLTECCKCKPNHHLPRIRSHTDSGLLNTASNGSGSTTSPPGPDIHWEFSSSLTGSWTPAFVCGNVKPSSWKGAMPANADWISSKSNGYHSGRHHVYYRLRFSLCDNIDPSKFKLTVNYKVDNTMREIYVNGNPQSGNVTVPGGGFSGQLSNVTLDHDWKKCENEIIFHTYSQSTYLGFIAGFSIAPLSYKPKVCKCECKKAKLPKYEPCFSISWGNSKKDKLKRKGCQVLCITACNCYSNLTFEDLTINQIILCDSNGNPIPIKPGGSSPIEIVPFGPVCFGDLGPCKPGSTGNCKSRQIVLRTQGAKPGYYQIKLGTVCYRIAYKRSIDTCFEFQLKK